MFNTLITNSEIQKVKKIRRGQRNTPMSLIMHMPKNATFELSVRNNCVMGPPFRIIISARQTHREEKNNYCKACQLCVVIDEM